MAGELAVQPVPPTGTFALLNDNALTSSYGPITLVGPEGATVTVQPPKVLDVNLAPALGIVTSSLSPRAGLRLGFLVGRGRVEERQLPRSVGVICRDGVVAVVNVLRTQSDAGVSPLARQTDY